MKFKVFVSGNQTELREQRLTAQDAILNSPVIRDFFMPFLFENLPAEGIDPVSTYLDEVKNSDIYLGILGSKYKTTNEDGISPTEIEYDAFIEHVNDGEVLIFIKCDKTIPRDPEINEFIKIYKNMEILQGVG